MLTDRKKMQSNKTDSYNEAYSQDFLESLGAKSPVLSDFFIKIKHFKAFYRLKFMLLLIKNDSPNHIRLKFK